MLFGIFRNLKKVKGEVLKWLKTRSSSEGVEKKMKMFSYVSFFVFGCHLNVCYFVVVRFSCFQVLVFFFVYVCFYVWIL